MGTTRGQTPVYWVGRGLFVWRACVSSRTNRRLNSFVFAYGFSPLFESTLVFHSFIRQVHFDTINHLMSSAGRLPMKHVAFMLCDLQEKFKHLIFRFPT